MPKKAVNYNETSFYKIVCNDLSIKSVYVGHTTNFIKRKCAHKYACTNVKADRYHLKLYETIRNNGDWENWSMILVQNISCTDSLHARKLEREFMESLNSDLNCSRSYATTEELRIKTKETKKVYYNNNKEVLLQNAKKYNELNKVSLALQKKEYRTINKEIINVKRKKNMICECGSVCRLVSKITHFKTKKHQLYVDSINK